jgi:tetratricopeptide (TPR) repeat protein
MKHNKILFCLALALLTLLVYLPALKNELIWDSKPMIMENDLLKGDFSLSAPFCSGYWAATSQRGGGYDYYRPLMVLSFMAEKAIWGLSPFRLRLVNLLLFIAALFCLYFFLCRQVAPPGVAEIAALLFALFPLHMDNINWVVGRCDLLMLLFGILALLLFDHFLEKRRPWLGLLALASYALALLSKEASLFFLPLFPLHELIRRRRLSLPIYLFPLLASAGFWLLKSAVIGRGGFPIRPFPTLWKNVLPVLGTLGYYARSLAFPFRYDMFLPMDAVQTPPYLVLGALFLLLLTVGAWLGRRKPQCLQAWFWTAPFLGGYLLMIFTPIFPFSISSRYLMIPAIGLTWLLAHGIHSLPACKKKLLLVGLLAASATAIIVNSQKYKNEKDFWARALRSYAKDSFFLTKYADQLYQNGEFTGSEILLRRALSFKMKNSTAVAIALQLSNIAFAKARYGESLDWLGKMRALKLDLLYTQHRLQRLLKIHLARGDLAAATVTLYEMDRAFSAEKTNTTRIELYLAFAEWEKARAAARALSALQAEEWLKAIRNEEMAFRSLGPDQQARFFISRGNFGMAWPLWPDKDSQGIPGQLQTAKLAIQAGHEEEGERRIEQLAKEYDADFKVLNSVGNLFFDLQRASEAIGFYRRSLLLNPAQSALSERVKWIQQSQQYPIAP